MFLVCLPFTALSKQKLPIHEDIQVSYGESTLGHGIQLLFQMFPKAPFQVMPRLVAFLKALEAN